MGSRLPRCAASSAALAAAPGPSAAVHSAARVSPDAILSVTGTVVRTFDWTDGPDASAQPVTSHLHEVSVYHVNETLSRLGDMWYLPSAGSTYSAEVDETSSKPGFCGYTEHTHGATSGTFDENQTPLLYFGRADRDERGALTAQLEGDYLGIRDWAPFPRVSELTGSCGSSTRTETIANKRPSARSSASSPEATSASPRPSNATREPDH